MRKTSIVGLVAGVLLVAGACFAQQVGTDAWAHKFRTDHLVSETPGGTVSVESPVNFTDVTDFSLMDTITFGDGSTIDDAYTVSTLKSSLRIAPAATADAVGRTRSALVTIGDATGTSAYGFNSTNHEARGLMVSVGRTKPAVATYTGGGFDEAGDFRVMNRLTNNAAASIRGLYVKAKNYTSGTVGGVEGAFIEAVNDGTDTGGASMVLKLGTDASTLDYGIDMDLVATPATADIRCSNGALIQNGDANTLTITERDVVVVGTLTSSKGKTTNFKYLSATGVTGMVYVVGGVITNVVTTGM